MTQTDKQTNRQTNTFYCVVKQVLLLFVIFNYFNGNSQALLEKQLLIEKKIELYTARSLASYILSDVKITELKNNLEINTQNDTEMLKKSRFENVLLEAKKTDLRKRYFERHPDELELFGNKNTDNNTTYQVCSDGGFETWPVTGTPWVFRQASIGLSGKYKH